MAWYWWIILIYLTIGFVGSFNGILSMLEYSGEKSIIKQIKEELPTILLISFAWLFILIGDFIWDRKQDRIAEKDAQKTSDSLFP